MFDLRYYQQEGVDETFGYLEEYPEGHPLLCYPTGSGKTPIIAELVKKISAGEEVLILSHVSHIINQNVDAIQRHMPDAKIGVYSAGLDRREIEGITVAGIQSVFRRPKEFQNFKKIIIDESHAIPHDGDGMYNKFLDSIDGHNKIGLTATPFRTGWGYIYGEDRMFSKAVADYTQGDKFLKLIDEGHISNIKIKATKAKMDTDVGMIAGDFNLKQLSKKNDRATVTETILDELMEKAEGRKKWLVFAIDIDHAEHIAESLIRRGISTMILHSKMEFDSARVIQDFKDDKYQCLVNVNMLTTGYDDPRIDLIVGMRPTESLNLYIQMIGRGLRVHVSKDYCLYLSFDGNPERLGPINDVRIRNKAIRKGENALEPAMKECPECSELVPPSTKKCPCGHVFEFKTKLLGTSSAAEVISISDKPKWHKVESVSYVISRRRNSPSVIIVTYECEGQIVPFKESVCIEHTGAAKYFSYHWIKTRGGTPCDTVDDFLYIKDRLKVPNKIRVGRKKDFSTVIDYSF